MTYQMTFQYLACQTCTAKIHCDRCGGEVAQSLLRLDGVDDVEINMVAKTISVSASADPDDIECRLEDLGVLVD